MDFFETLQVRRSVRLFTEDPVEPAQQEQILEAARRAPSAGNLQAYTIYAVTDKKVQEALAYAAYDQHYVSAAPWVLVFCADPERSASRYGERGRRLYAVQDATIACAYAQLAATALSLASVWIGAFDEDDVRRAVAAPERLRPVALLPIGHPREAPEARERRPLDDFVIRI